MLTIGIDTYINISMMNQYVSNHYLSTDPLRIQWESISDADKEVQLRNAFVQLNNLPFTGTKVDRNQRNPFPRIPWNDSTDYLLVEAAQAELVIYRSDTIKQSEFANALNLQSVGVVKFRIGDLSQEFRGGGVTLSALNYFGVGEEAYKRLSKWLSGGFGICTSTKQRRMCP